MKPFGLVFGGTPIYGIFNPPNKVKLPSIRGIGLIKNLGQDMPVVDWLKANYAPRDALQAENLKQYETFEQTTFQKQEY